MTSDGRFRTIVSRDNPQLKRWRRLGADPAAYRRVGEIWVEGDHLCAAYVQRGGTEWRAVVTEAGWATPSLRALAERAKAAWIVPDALMAELSALESPPSLCGVLRWPGPGLLDRSAPSVVLDRLQDAGNVGNLLRSAAAFGFTQVVALRGTVALWSGKVLRAGMGAHFGLRLVESATDDDLGTLTTPLLAASSHAANAIGDAVLPWPCTWVFGHEGQGLDPVVMRRCAQVLRIPQPGGEESLNVAAAAAVCLYESTRRWRTDASQVATANPTEPLPRAAGRSPILSPIRMG